MVVAKMVNRLKYGAAAQHDATAYREELYFLCHAHSMA
jgi:hypothetical protein